MPKQRNAFHGNDSLPIYGTREAPISKWRRLISKVVSVIIHNPEPAANIGKLMNWAAPANTVNDIRIVSAAVNPTDFPKIPYANPNGNTPSINGNVSRTPARNSPPFHDISCTFPLFFPNILPLQLSLGISTEQTFDLLYLNRQESGCEYPIKHILDTNFMLSGDVMRNGYYQNP